MQIPQARARTLSGLYLPYTLAAFSCFPVFRYRIHDHQPDCPTVLDHLVNNLAGLLNRVITNLIPLLVRFPLLFLFFLPNLNCRFAFHHCELNWLNHIP